MNRTTIIHTLHWPLVIILGSFSAFLTYVFMRHILGEVVDALSNFLFLLGYFAELLLWFYPALVFRLFYTDLEALEAEIARPLSAGQTAQAIALWSALFFVTAVGIPLSAYLVYCFMRDSFGVFTAGFVAYGAASFLYKLSIQYADQMKKKR